MCNLEHINVYFFGERTLLRRRVFTVVYLWAGNVNWISHANKDTTVGTDTQVKLFVIVAEAFAVVCQLCNCRRRRRSRKLFKSNSINYLPSEYSLTQRRTGKQN